MSQVWTVRSTKKALKIKSKPTRKWKGTMQNLSTLWYRQKSQEELNAIQRIKYIDSELKEKPNSTMIRLNKLLGSIKTLH